MSQLATVEPHPVQIAPKAPRRQRIPHRIRRACELLACGEAKTVKAAAKAVGLSREHLSKSLSKPHIEAFIADRARKTIAGATWRATQRIVDLMHASSEHVSLDAAKHVAAVNGIKPADQPSIVNNINVMAGYVLDLTAEQAPQQIEAKANDETS